MRLPLTSITPLYCAKSALFKNFFSILCTFFADRPKYLCNEKVKRKIKRNQKKQCEGISNLLSISSAV